MPRSVISLEIPTPTSTPMASTKRSGGITGKLCVLVIIGVDDQGKKHLLAAEDGVRESTQSWREVLIDLKSRGMNEPLLAVGDGALGFWAALAQICPNTKHQRCWFHKTGNIFRLHAQICSLARLKRISARSSKSANRKDAKRAITTFETKYGAKYPKAVHCLTKDTDALLAFYDFPAEHWSHLRTTNPIESTFSMVRHRRHQGQRCLLS